MQDAFVHCEQLVRAVDRDRFLATLFAPADDRGALYALYAFNAEIARVREVAREPLPGEVRLQWWSEVLRGERGMEAAANPVAAALLATVERHGLPVAALGDMIEARHFDLYDERMATIADLEVYAFKTSSALIAMAAQILGASAGDVARHAGVADAIARLLRAFPIHARRRQLYVPVQLLQRYSVNVEDVFAGILSPPLEAALAELRGIARHHLVAVNTGIATLAPRSVPAFLPLSVVGPALDRLDRGDPFTPRDVSPWRRQWLIWRAARNPRRIAS
jgi:15-cis-phytoene synthase